MKIAMAMTVNSRQSTFEDNLTKQEHTIALVVVERERLNTLSTVIYGKSPPQSLELWLVDESDPPPDIYALG